MRETSLFPISHASQDEFLHSYSGEIFFRHAEKADLIPYQRIAPGCYSGLDTYLPCI
jgi:hypothetical protein